MVLFDLLVDVAELRVPVRMLITFQGLGCALQAEPVFLQQPPYRGRGHTMPLPGQFGGQPPQRLRRPAQRRHRITALVRLDQRHQRRNQLPVNGLGPHPPATGAPDAPLGQRLVPGLELEHAFADGRLADASRARDQSYASVAEQSGLGRQRQPLLTLVQVWEQDLEPSRQLAANLVGYSHTASTRPPLRSNVLILDGFTCCGTPSATPPARTGTRSPASSSPSAPRRPRRPHSSGSPSSPTPGAGSIRRS